MADIFISYARSDRDRVKPLVDLFESNGYSVWWDPNIIPGSKFESVIDEAIQKARLVIVVWTTGSINSEWVLAEASDGLERDILIPVMLDDVRVPIAFRRRQSVRLRDWPDHKNHDELTRLLDATSDKLGNQSIEVVLPPERAAQPWYRRSPGIAIGLLVLFLTAFFFLQQKPLLGPAGEEKGLTQKNSPVASISVLPFDITGEIPERYQGMSFEIADLLTGAGAFQITSTEQVNTYLSQILSGFGSTLDSDYKLSGAFEKNDNNIELRIALKLASSTVPDWTQNYPMSNTPMPETIRTVANDIAGYFDIRLPILESDINETNYIAYLKAQAEFRKPKTLQGLQKSKLMFEHIIAAEPRFGDAYAGLCRTELALYQETQAIENFESAERHCHRANTLNSRNSRVYVALGALYRESGKFTESEDNLHRALELTPFFTTAMRELSKTLVSEGNYDEAEKRLQVALEIEPNYWLNYREMGRIQFMRGEYHSAADYYKVESELTSENSRALNNLGAAYFLAEEFELAIEAWGSTKELQQNDRTLSNLGSAYFFNREFERAADMYRQAIEIAPENHEYWSGLGEAASFSNVADYKTFYQTALDLAEARLAINPNDAMLRSAVATYYAAVGNSDKALETIAKLQEKNLKDVYVLYDLARAMIRLGDMASTRKYTEQLIALGYSQTLLSLDANFDELNRKEIKE